MDISIVLYYDTASQKGFEGDCVKMEAQAPIADKNSPVDCF